MARCAAGLRVGSAVAGGLAAVLGLGRPASPVLVAMAVAALLAWAGRYSRTALIRGWTTWLVVGDIAVAVAACLGQRWLVPSAALPDGSGWVFLVASTTVIISQLGPRPLLGAAATAAVPAAHGAGLLLAGLGGVSGFSLLLAVQGALVGSLMTILRRSCRVADAALAGRASAERDEAVRAARRAEERAQRQLLHDSVSATLTVVAAGGVAGSAALRSQARRDLAVIETLQAPAAATAGEVAGPAAASGPTGAEPVPPFGHADPVATAAPPGGPRLARTSRRSRPAENGLQRLVATQYRRGFDLAVVGLIGLWHLGNDLVTMLGSALTYRSLGPEVGAPAAARPDLAAAVLAAGRGCAGRQRAGHRPGSGGGGVRWCALGLGRHRLGGRARTAVPPGRRAGRADRGERRPHAGRPAGRPRRRRPGAGPVRHCCLRHRGATTDPPVRVAGAGRHRPAGRGRRPGAGRCPAAPGGGRAVARQPAGPLPHRPAVGGAAAGRAGQRHGGPGGPGDAAPVRRGGQPVAPAVRRDR